MASFADRGIPAKLGSIKEGISAKTRLLGYLIAVGVAVAAWMVVSMVAASADTFIGQGGNTVFGVNTQFAAGGSQTCGATFTCINVNSPTQVSSIGVSNTAVVAQPVVTTTPVFTTAPVVAATPVVTTPVAVAPQFVTSPVSTGGVVINQCCNSVFGVNTQIAAGGGLFGDIDCDNHHELCVCDTDPGNCLLFGGQTCTDSLTCVNISSPSQFSAIGVSNEAAVVGGGVGGGFFGTPVVSEPFFGGVGGGFFGTPIVSEPFFGGVGGGFFGTPIVSEPFFGGVGGLGGTVINQGGNEVFGVNTQLALGGDQTCTDSLTCVNIFAPRQFSAIGVSNSAAVLGAAPFAQVLPAVSQVLPVATVAPVAQVLPVAPMVPAPAFPVALGQVLTTPLVAATTAVGGGFERVALPATGSAGLHLASPSSAGAELSTSLIAGLLLLASGLTLLGGRHVRRVIMNRKLA